MSKLSAALVYLTAIFSVALFLGFVMAFPVKWLWNYSATPLGLPPLDVWHAWALSVLSSLLFKSHTTNNSKG